jgi:hypothetical protein
VLKSAGIVGAFQKIDGVGVRRVAILIQQIANQLSILRGILLEIPHGCFENCARVVGGPIRRGDRRRHLFQVVRFGSTFSHPDE